MSLTPLFINKPATRSSPPPSLADEQVRLVQERRELERERTEAARDERLEQRRAERRRAEAEATAADLGRAMEIKRPGYVASLIIAAGRKARGGLPGEPRLTGLAAEIVRMGRIRRGEAVADAVVLPENETARAVVFSAMRRRGEVLADADAQWLSAFLRKMEPRTPGASR